MVGFVEVWEREKALMLCVWLLKTRWSARGMCHCFGKLALQTERMGPLERGEEEKEKEEELTRYAWTLGMCFLLRSKPL